MKTKLSKEYQKLLLDKAYYKTAFDALADLLWYKDLNGAFVKINNNMVSLVGLEHSEIIGKTDHDLFTKERADHYRKVDKKAIDGDKPIVVREYLSAADNSFKGWFETTKTPMKDEDGNIIGVLGIARDINEIVQKELELKNIYEHDSLTGLLNRQTFTKKISELIEKKEKNVKHSLLFIDLDKFKEINDSLGHDIGDKILIMVAQRLHHIISTNDILARFGGDEFCIFLEYVQDNLKANEVAQRIITTLREPFFIDSYEFYITSSIGISTFPQDTRKIDELLKYSDSAMYYAKSDGKDRYKVYTKELTKQLIEHVDLINDLRRAIKNEEFELFYQIQVDALYKKIVGAEALIRWNHPDKGLVSPVDFIAVAESSGQIVELGKWITLRAMKDITEWKKNALNINKVSVNLSVRQLSDTHIISSLRKMLKDTGCKAEWIEFEITESYTMENPKANIKVLNNIVALGFTLSIDDFGTGYSSLSYLKQIPVSKLKIDKSFIDDILKGEEGKSIVNAFILIAKSMNLEVIAEGVEMQEQEHLLLDIGCNLIQGYLYSKPVQKQKFMKLINELNR
jgi:diguanylate cyclase (GGDEF)-like protein/PAS domain S-box-containing protein